VTEKATTRMAKRYEVEILKADASLGLVFGRAIICTKGGKPYFDTQGDHVPDRSMIEASADFMENGAAVNVNHAGDDVGPVVFAMPYTKEVAKAFGLTDADPKKAWTGLMVAARPTPGVLKRCVAGELKSFSIEGERVEHEVVEADEDGT